MLMFGWDFYKQNSTFGSVVPLAIFSQHVLKATSLEWEQLLWSENKLWKGVSFFLSFSFPFSLDRPNRFGDIVILFNWEWEGSHLTDLLKDVFTAGLFPDPVIFLNSLLTLLQVEPVSHCHRHLLGSHLRGLVSEAQSRTCFWQIKNNLWLWICWDSPQYCPTSSAGGGCAELEI